MCPHCSAPPSGLFAHCLVLSGAGSVAFACRSFPNWRLDGGVRDAVPAAVRVIALKGREWGQALVLFRKMRRVE
jgi:hypothetical protein